jgi:hypothetical protein
MKNRSSLIRWESPPIQISWETPLIPVRKCFHHFLDLRHPSIERTDGVSDCSQWSGYSLHVRNDPLNFRAKPIELFIGRKRSPLLIVH